MPARRAHATLTARVREHAATCLVQPVYARPTPALEPLTDVNERCMLVRMPAGARSVARLLSARLPGQWWMGNRSVTWNLGGNLLYLVEEGWHEAVDQARAVAALLGVDTPSYSVGGVARALLKWVGPGHRHYGCSQRNLEGLPWAYRLAVPGNHGPGRLVDLAGAYHQALTRLPSPHLTWLDSGPIWHPLEAGGLSRWRDLLAAVLPCKPLRLLLVGCMIGGGEAQRCYVGGELLAMTMPPGPFRTAGLAVVRACYELTALQATEANAPYANTDSVVLPEHGSPRVWERFGYQWRTVAEGECEVRSLDVYRVGEKETYWWKVGSRFTLAEHGGPLPERWTFTAWQ